MIDIKTYSVPKGNGESNGGNSNTLIINNGGSYEFEPHYLWGQYFDDTQDIDGDLTSNGTIRGNNVVATTKVSGATVEGNIINGATGNITTVNSTTLNGTTVNGGIVNGTTKITSPLGEITTVNSTTLNGTTGNITTVNSTNVNTNNLSVTVQAIIKALQAEDITCDNLTVTKAAHFFKLIIDEIKASKGQVIITPANAKLDLVESITGGYRCYFRANDADGNQIFNSFEANDQIVCQTFNVASGVSYSVSNKYYWRLCTAVSSSPVNKTIDGQTVSCHYIDLSDSDKDQYTSSAPEAGDEIVMLGNRNDTTRQAAIIISAYNNSYLDNTIESPSIVQYQGINDYNLANHRLNVISKSFNEFHGSFKSTTGQDIEDLIDDIETNQSFVHQAWANSADGQTDFTKVNVTNDYLYMGICSNFTESDALLTYSDYIWNRVRGADGQNGTNGIGISSVTEYYLASPNSTGVTRSTSGWSTTPPNIDATNKYLWNYEDILYTDNTHSYSEPVIIGVYGEDGIDGTDGRGISSITEYYLATSANSGVTRSTSGWTTTIQTVTSTNKYLWNYEMITYTSGNPTYTAPVIIGTYGDKGDKGDKGNNGTSITISSTSVTYAVTTTSSQPADSAFIYNSIPSVAVGDYLWSKQIVTFSDGSSIKSYAVSRIGADGTDGDNGLDGKTTHFAYSTSADGSQNFSTTLFSGATYIGSYDDYNRSDSTDYRDYSWTKLKGDTGANGTSVTITSKSVQYQVSTSGTVIPTGTWSNSIPSVSPGNYLWTRVIVNYSDGNSTTAYSVSYYGTNGTNGTNGSNAQFYMLSPIKEQAVVDRNGTLGVSCQYNILYVNGFSVIQINAAQNGYHVILIPDNATQQHPYDVCSYNTTTPSYTNASYQTDYNNQSSKTMYFKAQLVYGSNHTPISGQSSCFSVVMSAAATLDINSDLNTITSTVQGHTTELGTITNNVSQIQQDMNSISSTVSTINSNYASQSYVNQTANKITSMVESVNNIVNVFGFNRGAKPYNTNCMLWPYGYGFMGWGTNLNRIINLGITEQNEDWTLYFQIRATANTAVTVELCDAKPNTTYKNTTAQSHTWPIDVTTSWETYRMVWNNLNSPYIGDAMYLGFIDFEQSGSNTIYVRNITLCKGDRPYLEFRKANEDLEYTGSLQGFNWDISNMTTEGNFRGLTVYKNSVRPNSSNTYYDLIRYSNITIKDMTPYTLSFWAKASGTNVHLHHFLYNGSWNLHIDKGEQNNGTDGFWDTELTTEWKHYTVHWMPHLDTLSGTASQKYIKNCIACRYENVGNNSTSDIYMAGVMFQEGWIEDGAGTETSLIEQTNSSITMEVTNRINGDKKYFPIIKPFYDYEFKLITEYKDNPLRYYGESDIYSTPTYVTAGTYKIRVFFTDTNLQDIIIASYGTNYPSDLGSYNGISLSLGRTYNSIKCKDNTTLYEFTGEVTISTDGYYGINFWEDEYLYIPDMENEFETNYSRITQTANSITSQVNSLSGQVSTIDQKADNILLQVQDCGVNINEHNITLNGDTDINGTLTINDEDTGFLLAGNSGSTQISPKSLGTYSDFTNTTTNVLRAVKSYSLYISNTQGNNYVSAIWSFTQSFGNVQSGASIPLTLQNSFFRGYNQSSVIEPSSISNEYKIYIGDTLVQTYTNYSRTLLTIGTFTTSSSGELKIVRSTTAVFTKEQIQANPIIIGELSYKIEIPNSAFTLIGYDGIASNFGTNANVYFGSSGAFMKYGQIGLGVTASGLTKWNGNNWVPLNYLNVVRTSSTNYTIPDNVDMVVTTGSADQNVIFPFPSSCTGRVIYVKRNAAGDIKIWCNSTSTTSGNYFLRPGDWGTYEATLWQDSPLNMYISDGQHWIRGYQG